MNTKRMISVILAAVLSLFSLAACQTHSQSDGEKTSTDGAHKLKIVTTIFPQFDFARQIAGDRADVTMLLQPGAESHSYEPTPQDIKNIQNCDLFIYTGGENDVWVDGILDSMGEQKPDTLRLVDCVPTVEEEIVEGMEHDADEAQGHSHGDDGEIDEHVWTSPKNAVEIVKKMTGLISEKDPDNAGTYEENSAAYIGQLEKLDSDFRQAVDHGTRRTILFGDRFPFRYFAEEYGLTYYAAFPGCAAETEASAATVAFLVDTVKEQHLPVVFTIELSNGKIADSICETTGAKKLTMYSCHNVTKDQMEVGATYLSLMTDNLESLRAALN